MIVIIMQSNIHFLVFNVLWWNYNAKKSPVDKIAKPCSQTCVLCDVILLKNKCA